MIAMPLINLFVILQESHHNVLVYQWVPGPGGLGHLHRVLQDVKDELDIANFSVFQTNLDDVSDKIGLCVCTDNKI